jgi:hypothetical protein
MSRNMRAIPILKKLRISDFNRAHSPFGTLTVAVTSSMASGHIMALFKPKLYKVITL